MQIERPDHKMNHEDTKDTKEKPRRKAWLDQQGWPEWHEDCATWLIRTLCKIGSPASALLRGSCLRDLRVFVVHLVLLCPSGSMTR
jgi:hypothetical protein